MSRVVQRRAPILVTGAPRSGTSWLGELLANCPRVRYVYEPFNVQWNSDMEGVVRHFEYMKPESLAARDFRSHADRAFLGQQHARQLLRSIYRRYFWQAVRPFDHLVVKDPTACLMAEWISANYGARVLVIMRHPCAFVSSIMKLGWRLDAGRFLDQPQLMADFLSPYEAVIKRCQIDPWTRAAAVWCIIHVVLLSQIERNPGWMICKYEDLCNDDGTKLASLADKLELDSTRDSSALGQFIEGSGNTDPGSTKKMSKDMPLIWKRRLTTSQIDSIMTVVEEFGLSHLYAETAV